MSTAPPSPHASAVASGSHGVPEFDVGLFSEEAIADPYPLYRRLRDLGPVVHLTTQQIHAVGRYDEVRAVLADDETFLSDHGVFFSEHLNQLMRGTILAGDGPEHERLRQVVAHRLTPRALREEQASIEAKADALVTALLERDDVLDAVTDIAQAHFEESRRRRRSPRTLSLEAYRRQCTRQPRTRPLPTPAEARLNAARFVPT